VTRSCRTPFTALVLRRIATRAVGAAALLLGAAVTLHAQDTEPDRLARLDATSRYNIRVLMDSADMAELPSSALRSIALEGISKKADAKAIVLAVRQELGLLRVARATLGPVDPEELTAAAALLRAGAKPAQLSTFRIRQRGRSDLQAFTVWADLLWRGVPVEDASSAITKLWDDGADDATFLSLWNNVQSDILRGLNPGAALQARIREAPGRPPTAKGPPPEGQQESQRSE
jgi:hypothetical protein